MFFPFQLRIFLTFAVLKNSIEGFMDLDKSGIATGNTKEDKKQRKQFIVDFYGKWIAANNYQ